MLLLLRARAKERIEFLLGWSAAQQLVQADPPQHAQQRMHDMKVLPKDNCFSSLISKVWLQRLVLWVLLLRTVDTSLLPSSRGHH